MKTLFGVFVFLFSLSAFALEDKCATECSEDCGQQVAEHLENARIHKALCYQGRDPKARGTHECALSCSWGCRSYIRGKNALAQEHIKNCKVGVSFASLSCEKNEGNGLIYPVNTHTNQQIGGGFSLSTKCKDAINTKNFGAFCSKSTDKDIDGYKVFSANTGDSIGVGVSFLKQCRKFIQKAKNWYICTKSSQTKYSMYDLVDFSKVSSKNYSFHSQCVEDL